MYPSIQSNPQPDQDPPVLQTCRTQHQTWAVALEQSEAEIDQLLTLLAEVPRESNRSLNHYTADYSQALGRLKSRIHEVRIDVVCAGAGCSTPAPVSAETCSDRRFVPPMTGNPVVASVAAEYDRMKERCQAFLGELMRLNLI